MRDYHYGLACREPPLWCLSVKKRPKDLPLAGARDAGACPSPSPLRGCVQETLAALHPVFGGERANRDPHTAWQAGQRAQKHALLRVEVMPRLAPRAALCAGALALYALLCAAAPSTAAPPVDALEEEQYFEGVEAGTCAPPGQPTRVQRLASLV